MKTRKNRTPKPITKQRLQELALRYVGRYAATRLMLERNLKNHVRKATPANSDVGNNEATAWVREIVDTCAKKGFVNDEAYADMVVRSGRASGWSGRKIGQKLLIKGITSGAVRELLADSDEDDMQAAILYIKRKHLGPYRKNEDADRRKEMEKICRGGFSLDIARKLVKMNADQCAELLEELRTR